MGGSPERGERLRRDGRYRLIEEIGRGGMGVVWRAEDRERGGEVALKELGHSSPESLLRFKREFRALADVHHPNLVTLYELFSDDSGWAFTMELLEGAVDFVTWIRGARFPDVPTGSPTAAPTVTHTAALADAISSKVSLAPAASFPEGAGTRLQEATLQLTGGVTALHRSGHLHRDIKPSNVLVTPAGRVVVLDFGIVAEIADHPDASASVLMGTPGYVAPEQAGGQPASEASDWYAVGVVLYECLVGRRPFMGTADAVLAAKQRWDAIDPTELVEAPTPLATLCLDLVSRDPAQRPRGHEIVERLDARSTVPAPLVPVAVELVGRDEELDALEQALSASAERGVAMYVHGLSGMGKTALVQTFLDRCREGGALVLAGRCYERELVPYRAVDSVVDALAEYLRDTPDDEARPLIPDDIGVLAEMFPVLGGVDVIAEASGQSRPRNPVEARRSAAVALRQLLTRIAERRSTVVFIDDLHWGDIDSALLLDLLMRPPTPPLLLLAAYRTDETRRSPLLKTLFRRRARLGPAVDERFLELSGLSLDDAAALTRRLAGGDEALSAEVARALAAGVNGNPYFLQELVQHTVGGIDEPSELPSIEHAIENRVRGLEEATRRALEVVSLSAGPLAQRVVERAAELEPTQWLSIAQELRARNMIRTSGSGGDDLVEPYHDRVRESVAAMLDKDTRRRHHLALARSFERHGSAGAGRLAHHYLEGGQTSAASRHARRAADDAVRGLAFERAARLYQLALAHAESPEDAQALRVDLGNALINAGLGAEGADCLLMASRKASGPAAVDLQRQAAEQYLRSGQIDDGLRELTAVMAAVGLPMPKSALRAVPSLLWYRFRNFLRGRRVKAKSPETVPAHVTFRADVCFSAAVGLAMIDPARGAGFSERSITLAHATGDLARISKALSLNAGLRAGEPNPETAKRILERGHELAERADDDGARALAILTETIGHYQRAEWRAALETAERTEAHLRRHGTGVAWELRTCELFVLGSYYYLGELAELGAQAPVRFADAERRGDLYATTSIGALMLPAGYLGIGDPESARAEIERAEASWTGNGFFLQNIWMLWMRIICDLYEGNYERADELCRGGTKAANRSLIVLDRAVGHFWRYLRASTALAADLRTGSRKRHRWIKRVARKLRKDGAPTYVGMSLLLRAGVLAARDKREEAVALLIEASERFDEDETSLFSALAMRRAGELEGGESSERYHKATERIKKLGGADPARLSDALVPQFLVD